MTNRPILFVDSGIGGIPYCSHFLMRNPGESIVYLADRRHFPYGKREKKDLIDIVSGLVGMLIATINPKIAVLACNTATLAALAVLRKRFPALPFVGTVPAVKPAALASKNGRIGVLGTELTIREPLIRELAARYGNGQIIGIAAPELVEFIECRFLSATDEEKRAMAQGFLNRFRSDGVDSLVLGCTHFLFLQEEFRQEAAPDITVFDSLMGITRRIESLLSETGRQERFNEHQTENRLLLTGTEAPEPSWTSWADRLGFSLSLLEKANAPV
jgi:glutamate racemase